MDEVSVQWHGHVFGKIYLTSGGISGLHRISALTHIFKLTNEILLGPWTNREVLALTNDVNKNAVTQKF